MASVRSFGQSNRKRISYLFRLIEPDGSDGRLLFTTGEPKSRETMDIQQPAWKPDASELAFASSHEAGCSLYQADIYTIRPDGSEQTQLVEGRRTGSEIVPADYPRVPGMPVQAGLSVRLREAVRGGKKWLQYGDSFSRFWL